MLNNADSKNLRLLTWFNFFNGFNLYAPVAILYFAQVSGSFALGGAVFAITMITAALFEVPTGLVSDMVGRRKTAIYGAVAIVVGVLCYAIGLSFWFLVLGAVFEGLSRSFFSGNNTALLYDTLAEDGAQDQYHAALGWTSASGQVAMAVSAVIGAAVASVSFPLAVWLSVWPQIVCLLLCFGIVEPKQHNSSNGAAWAPLREALRQFKADRRLRLLTLAGMLDFGFGETS
jgi:MFS family permease